MRKSVQDFFSAAESGGGGTIVLLVKKITGFLTVCNINFNAYAVLNNNNLGVAGSSNPAGRRRKPFL